MRPAAIALGFLTTCVALPSAAQVTAEQLATAEIRTERVADGLYVLFGLGGNIAASVGADGVLIVDAQFPELVPRYLAAIRAVGGADVDFAINTHWHYDHADGNLVLGPTGTWIVAHANSREMLLKDNVINTVVRPPFPQKAYPPAARPVATFTDRMQLHFNGQTIDLLHTGPAHTTGDAAVIFREHNAVHMGDVFNNAGYPFIDTDNGGDLDGTIAFCEAVLAELRPGAIVIPGHGAVAKYEDLAAYIEMLKGVRAKLTDLIRGGATLEQAIAAKPTAEWDARYGDPTRMVNRGYAALTRDQAAAPRSRR
jgi:glyoxylase-like metal-dependent hydrolase (beta-lactamase superfamily II)